MKKENKIEMMSLEDMISSQSSWKKWLSVARKILNRIRSIEETKANRWELKSLEMSYEFFIDQMDMIVFVYGGLIDCAKDDSLERYVFDRAIKEIQNLNRDLKKEFEKKSFKELNNKYVHGIREAEIVTSL